jgi:hypothetical protein
MTWIFTGPQLVLDSFFNLLRNSERILFELLGRKLKDIIRIKVKNKPNDDDYGECYEARTIVD